MATPRCVVLGVGNTLWADEGLGPKLVELFRKRFDVPDVELIDGGTRGLYLLPIVTDAENLLVFDAVKLGQAPGTVTVLKDDEIDTIFRGALSLHQTTLHDLLASARLIGWQPQHVVLVGIEAEDTENWGGGLSATVTLATEKALLHAENILREWGLEPARKGD